ncbi:cation diffusion facilitator family transporter [Bacillus sp. V59.32b]|uniref:cation diffusion facilitator family transporter n=1 Tax=Bacillus sp. V59.32b TaxID=1758642 RepID=UPI000E3C738B|nr:cation diffusion facilitator family transporter [Bacillus sp. V59.32b]RFU64321.1 cation transporter [Bacillus sp. V59.32b]
MLRKNKISSAEKGAYISIVAYLFLAALKLTIGHYGNSQGLWADGLNNSTDIIASIAVLVGLKISKRPPDDDHLYGHMRAETIASLVAAFIMVSVGLQVIIGAVQSFIRPDQETPGMLTAYTALFSALFMLGVYLYNIRLSKRINSAAIHAVAQDNKSDSLVSIGAFIGIIGTKFGLGWLDSVAALAVGLIICRTAWSIFRDASHTLTDGFDEALLQEINETIASGDRVKATSDIKARMHGNEIFLEATVHVDPQLTVIEGHDITEEIENTLQEKHHIKHAIIHVEPHFITNKN